MKKSATIITLIFLTIALGGCSPKNEDLMVKAKAYRQKGEHKSAIIELKNALQKNNSNAEARYLLGATYFDTRNYSSAEPELRRALELGYDRNQIVPLLGKSLLQMGAFQKIVDLVPLDDQAPNETQADMLTVRARALVGLKDSSKARTLLDQALVKKPEFADALIELARLALGEGKPDESIRLLDSALASGPNNVDAWLLKGDIAQFRGDQAGRLAANQKVLEVDAKNEWARLNIALIHIANKNFNDARKLVNEVRSLAPGNVMAGYVLALLEHRAGNHKAANEAIQPVVKAAPNYLPNIVLAGAIATELGSYEQAQAHLASALDRAPSNLYVRKLMVAALARSGQIQRALEILQPGLNQAPDDATLLSLSGELQLQKGEFGKAAEFFDKAAKHDPKNALARSKAGISRMQAGDTARAFADLESAVALDSANYQSDIVLVVAHLRQGNFDQALKAMASLEKKQPSNPQTFNLKAAIFLGKKDISNARKNLERALELQPAFFAATTTLAQLDIQEKNPKGARARIESLLNSDKSNVQALLTLAELAPALGASPKEQIDWLERARAANPRLAQPAIMLASLHLKMGDPKKALEVAERAQSSSPENPQLLELLGSAQMNAGQKDQALASYRKLVNLQPKSPAAIFALANAQFRAGDNASAEASLKQALVLKPDFAEALLALVPIHLAAKRYPEALSVALRFQKQLPKAPTGYAIEGDVLMSEKKFPQAAKAYEKALGVGRDSTLLIKLHGAHTFAGNSQTGDARLAQWLKESPEDELIRLYVAGEALKRANYKEAISHYEWVQKRRPDNVVVLNNLAWTYSQVKDPRALETAERAYTLAPENHSVGDTLGSLLIEAGDARRGIDVLEKAAKTAPKVAEIHYHLAQGWIKLSDKTKARAALEHALSIDDKFSKHEDAQRLLKQLRE
jgi:putative PEP-CTERM system TPR-repeat lipoprotein